GVDRYPEIGVGPVPRLDHVVLLLPGDAVLRTEQGAQVFAPAQIEDDPPRRDEMGRDRRRVHQETHAAVLEPARPGPRQDLDSGPDTRGPAGARADGSARHEARIIPARDIMIVHAARPDRPEKYSPVRARHS